MYNTVHAIGFPLIFSSSLSLENSLKRKRRCFFSPRFRFDTNRHYTTLRANCTLRVEQPDLPRKKWYAAATRGGDGTGGGGNREIICIKLRRRGISNINIARVFSSGLLPLIIMYVPRPPTADQNAGRVCFESLSALRGSRRVHRHMIGTDIFHIIQCHQQS